MNFGTFNNAFVDEVFLPTGGGDRVDGPILPLQTWMHVAVVYDGLTTTIYRDGIAVGTKTFAEAPAFDSPQPITIGVDTNDDGVTFTDAFDGRIDEVRIEPVARDAAWLLQMTALPLVGTIAPDVEEVNPN